MKKTYIVHDAVNTTTPMPATLADGTTVSAEVATLHVQLVAEETGATIQLPIVKPTDEDRALFAEGARVAVEFTAA